ncbi:unnamed protein product, partial [Brassica oleracea]
EADSTVFPLVSCPASFFLSQPHPSILSYGVASFLSLRLWILLGSKTISDSSYLIGSRCSCFSSLERRRGGERLRPSVALILYLLCVSASDLGQI